MPAKTKSVSTHEAVCAYCLNTVCLVPGTSFPVRHGWHSKGGRGGANGQLGSWHSGPCKGVNFPHLGVSTEGLVAAIADLQAAHERAVAHRAELDSFPVLHHARRDYNLPGRPVVAWIPVARGQKSPMSGPGYHSDYETLHATAIRERDNEVDRTGQWIPIFKSRLAGWTPSDATPVK